MLHRRTTALWAVIAGVTFVAGTRLVRTQVQKTLPEGVVRAFGAFSANRMLADIRTLASDRFEGRGPGTRGETLTIRYIARAFRVAGLEPGWSGSFFQRVPLVGMQADPRSATLELLQGSRRLTPRFGEDFVAWSKRPVPHSEAAGEVVFVGYGIRAPEYHWDDFKGTDLRGRVLLVLVNNPPFRTVNGKTVMTYYGRWTYKFEEAARQGAAACFIIHDTEAAGYPWEVVRGSWTGEQFDLDEPEENQQHIPIEGWITRQQAEAIFRLAGQDFAQALAAARRPDFRPMALGVQAQARLQNTVRRVISHNVIARLPGSEPSLRQQCVVYLAHWDHLGRHGGEIFHGAVDNASGVALLLELARAYRTLPRPPSRSVLFVAVTGEEQGLLGSQYYAAHPACPVGQTTGAINMDAMNVWGPTRDIVSIGMGESSMDDFVAQAAAALGRQVRPDPEPEKGFFFRSDHFSLVRAGVPAFDPNPGIDFIGRPLGWGIKVRQQYTAERYHKPADTVQPDWNLQGLVEDGRLFFLIGYELATTSHPPQLRSDSPFVRRSGGKSARSTGAPGAAFALQSEKILQQPQPDRRQNRLGMKLHALHLPPTMPEAHHNSVGRFRRDLEFCRDAATLDDQRMVAGGQKRRREALEDCAAVVMNLAGFSVIDRTRAHNAPAERFTNRLMPQAHAEQRNPPGKLANDVQCDPGAAGRSRSGRDDNALRPQPGDFFHTDLIVAPHDELLPELAQILRQVVGK